MFYILLILVTRTNSVIGEVIGCKNIVTWVPHCVQGNACTGIWIQNLHTSVICFNFVLPVGLPKGYPWLPDIRIVITHYKH